MGLHVLVGGNGAGPSDKDVKYMYSTDGALGGRETAWASGDGVLERSLHMGR